MKTSTKGRYALRMMLDIAKNSNGAFVPLKDIASRQNISKKYLEQIVPILNNSGFLVAGRGYQGGYKLSKQPSEYTVYDILKVTEGDLSPVSCLAQSQNQCERCNFCETLPVWEGLNEVISNYLKSITLQDILEEKVQRLFNKS